MTCFVRDVDGDMVNLEMASRILIDRNSDDDGYLVIAVLANGVRHPVQWFTDRDNAEKFVNQIAARANGSAPMPIGREQTTVFSRGLRFGPPAKRTV